jgi:Ser/Thr protein kinase RdoA (MazF antagonist)
MSDHRPIFDEIARRALDCYDMHDIHLTFLRHSDNVTYKVDHPSTDTFLLRIHIPITKAMGEHGADAQAVSSELLWLEALCEDTDLILQKPVRNQEGELVTKISFGESGATHNCTLLQWIDGESYHRDLESEATAYQIGEILAKLHNHAKKWEIPRDFKRPKRDIPYFESVLNGLHPALTDDRISSKDYLEFETSIDLLSSIIRSMEDNHKNYGIMHADSHKGNMLILEGNIRLIDFSFCAFGYFMFDLGICLSDMKERLHHACLSGYQSLRALPDNYRRLIEGFFIGSMVGTFSFWVRNPQAQELFARKVPQIARDFARKFNQGEHFWFS